MRERYHRRLAAIFPRGETFEMRKLLILVGALLVVHVALLLVHVPGAAQPAPRDAVTVGIVLDVGGLGDKSFNDGAYRGAQRAEKELGAHIRLIEPGEATDREAGLRLLAAEKMDLVVGVGFIFTDDINQLAKEYPNVNFADVDYSVATDKDGRVIPPPPNVAALKFKEEEGSFLVGAIAALAGGSKKVGFVGGMDVPLIHKFEAGYKAGVKAVCPDCTVIVQYAGVTPEAFRNPGKGKELALSQYQQGVNVIYHASGSTGLGVFEAARQTGKYAIGVDADQYSEAPGRVMTSMVKGIDVAVFDMIKRAKEGTFKGGVYTFGLPEGGVGYVYDTNNRALISDSVRARVEQLKADIIAGKIQVPSTR
jgi:basic membrane protein A